MQVNVGGSMGSARWRGFFAGMGAGEGEEVRRAKKPHAERVERAAWRLPGAADMKRVPEKFSFEKGCLKGTHLVTNACMQNLAAISCVFSVLVRILHEFCSVLVCILYEFCSVLVRVFTIFFGSQQNFKFFFDFFFRRHTLKKI